MNQEKLHRLLIQYRRDLHRIPELDRDLPKTTAYLKEVLSALPCQIVELGNAGFAAFFKARAADGAIAFRTDMDALPVTETTGADYSSVHAGRMHACGHDGHMSILLGLALEAAERFPDLPKNLLLIFQAAEETTGGAADIVASGVFDRFAVEKVYGLHLWPGHDKNTIVCRRNEFMASTMVFYVDIEGRSSHVATFQQGIDALDAGCRLVAALYEMERTELPAETFRLLRVCVFESGTAVNVVPEKARLEGTLRTYSQQVHDFMWNRILAVAEDIQAEMGCVIRITHSTPYPAVVNPEELFDAARTHLRNAGFDFWEPERPLMVSEDYSWYQRARPGLFFHLGTGVNIPLHNGKYQIDEDVLITGVRAFLTLLDAEQKED